LNTPKDNRVTFKGMPMATAEQVQRIRSKGGETPYFQYNVVLLPLPDMHSCRVHHQSGHGMCQHGTLYINFKAVETVDNITAQVKVALPPPEALLDPPPALVQRACPLK
jgi:hypothetical protein